MRALPLEVNSLHGALRMWASKQALPQTPKQTNKDSSVTSEPVLRGACTCGEALSALHHSQPGMRRTSGYFQAEHLLPGLDLFFFIFFSACSCRLSCVYARKTPVVWRNNAFSDATGRTCPLKVQQFNAALRQKKAQH